MKIKNPKKQLLLRLIIKLWSHLGKNRRRQFAWLFVLMLVSVFAEMVSLAAIIPFLGILTAPEHIFDNDSLQPLFGVVGIGGPDQLVLPLTVGFIVIAFFSGVIRIVLLYLSIRLSHLTGGDLSVNIYARTLYQDYEVHLARNSSELINGVVNKTGVVIGGVVMPLLVLLSSSFLVFGLVSALIIIDTVATFSAVVCFGALYVVIGYFTRTNLKYYGKVVAKESTHMVKALQEGLGGIRDVLVDNNQQFYIEAYRKADYALRRADGDIAFIGSSPRYIIEAIGISLIAALAYFMSQLPEGMEGAIPVLGALALAAQRLLPALQQAYSSISSIRGSAASLGDIIALLDQDMPDYASSVLLPEISFQKRIRLRDVHFCYAETDRSVLSGVDIDINKGDRVGIVGETGSGKSTLVDIIMGLLVPTRGKMMIDDQRIGLNNKYAWSAHIAHVPQRIFLVDGSIEENIAFGVPMEHISRNKVEQAASQAQISGFIGSMPDKYETIVGECGVRLSGGQRQRIGIARALYKNADVIVLDEATSALDNETESAVMEAIEELSAELTLIIVAHRHTTLEKCDYIYRVSDGNVTNVGDYGITQ